MNPRYRGFPFARVCTALAILAVLIAAGCSRERATPTGPTSQVTTSAATAARVAGVIAVQDRSTPALLRIPGVTGTATALGSDGSPVVRVYLQRAGVRGVPATIEGVRVETEVIGVLRPFSLTGRYRPVPIGVSLDNDQQCALGTLGCIVIKGSAKYALSANHVLARQNQAAIGEAIVQPARGESKNCVDHLATDKVAELADYEPLRFDGSDNVMDAAIARLVVPDARCATLPGFYGQPGSAIVPATLDLAIKKVGRTTELTTGQITAINATFDVTYPLGTAHFVGLFVTSHPFGKYGDSGSLIVTNDSADNPVGVLFGGDSNGTGIAYPIGPVLDRFGVSICGN